MEKMIEHIDFRLVDDAKQNRLADKVYQHLGLPDSTFLGTRITKKMLLDSSSHNGNELSPNDKKLVTDVIQSIEWLNTLKPETLNIPVYVTDTVEYIEVAVIRVTLKLPQELGRKDKGKHKSNASKKVTKLIHTLIPYPVILLLELADELLISLADKRINQADKTKLVIEHIYNSDWLNSSSLTNAHNDFLNDFSLKNVSNLNYFELYQDFIAMLIGLETSKISGRYMNIDGSSKNLSIEQGNLQSESQGYTLQHDSLLESTLCLTFREKSNEDKTALLRELAGLEAELNNIRNKIKKDTQMNTKLRLNVEARKIKQAISAITSQMA
ncbi:DUF4391 domain-containing protein [Shewanella frigidimarina]|uniref:DUF4391 domain-containing protein n=1 Tax=Shewanella frigidimarina TaxID=56812 RepID=UPI003D7AD88F